MTQKEKAKAYDEALERAKKCLDENRDTCFVRPDVIFPELADKDERIRKTLIEYFNTCFGDYYGELKKSDILAWLEKQGEKKPVIEMITPEESLGIESETYNEIVNACIFGENKPKFKVGDWVVNNTTLNLCHILKVEHGQYICSDCSFPITKEKEYHLWTINDAKEGDVLSYETDEEDLWIMIYWSLYEPYEGHVHYHALLVNDEFYDKGTCCICINDLKPATKKQRNLLFQKMKESEYEWDAEKKELKKIEQKPADRVEPKFKVGNWYQCTKDFFGKGVTFDKDTAYYCAKEGCLQDEYGCHIAIVKDLYDNFKLWTIQDAKPGDVLVDVYGNIGIFEKHDDFDWTSYCSLGCNGGFRCFRVEHENDKAYPATKEQRDLLFSKMEEARYEWDAENLQLTKILHVKELSDGINIDKQKLAEWSEEDDWIKTKIIKVLLGCETFLTSEETNECIDWIKSIKQRLKGKS